MIVEDKTRPLPQWITMKKKLWPISVCRTEILSLVTLYLSLAVLENIISHDHRRIHRHTPINYYHKKSSIDQLSSFNGGGSSGNTILWNMTTVDFFFWRTKKKPALFLTTLFELESFFGTFGSDTRTGVCVCLFRTLSNVRNYSDDTNILGLFGELFMNFFSLIFTFSICKIQIKKLVCLFFFLPFIKQTTN